MHILMVVLIVIVIAMLTQNSNCHGVELEVDAGFNSLIVNSYIN